MSIFGLACATYRKNGNFSTTILRGAVIKGAGGASFEMIRRLVERLPVMITPYEYPPAASRSQLGM